MHYNGIELIYRDDAEVIEVDSLLECRALFHEQED